MIDFEEKIYVINMDRSEDRWKRWQNEKRVQIQRIRAVDGKRELRPSDAHYFRNADYRRPAVKGCALSHLKAMKTAISNEESYAIICEDDVIMEDCVNERIQLVKRSLPNDWKIVFFTREKNDSSFPYSIAKKKSSWNFSGATMYMISSAAMHAYIQKVENHGFYRALDWDLIDFFPNHFLHPVGAYTLDGTTTIQNEWIPVTDRGISVAIVATMIILILCALLAHST
tara:strand:- start:2979 stop:3662 length:684 start_codon:yes stop_codon:yes gene_type:complete